MLPFVSTVYNSVKFSSPNSRGYRHWFPKPSLGRSLRSSCSRCYAKTGHRIGPRLHPSYRGEWLFHHKQCKDSHLWAPHIGELCVHPSSRETPEEAAFVLVCKDSLLRTLPEGGSSAALHRRLSSRECWCKGRGLSLKEVVLRMPTRPLRRTHDVTAWGRGKWAEWCHCPRALG